ncbi:MAG: Uma2 family endonuclease [Dehalococcoidia bacterium]
MVATSKKLLTAEDLQTMPDDGQRYELVKGELRAMPPAFGNHGRVAGRITRLINAFDPEGRLGEAFLADTGFKVETQPDSVRAPDIAYVIAGRADEADESAYPAMAPDLAVEVLSASNSASEMAEKVEQFLAAGCRLVWLVNRIRRTVTVWVPGETARVLHEDDEIDGGDVIPGFRCRVADFFPPARITS